MVGILWTGISGLSGQQTALDNESHNIANVNTIGYKSSRISFADQVYQNQIGKGTQIVNAEKIYTQGTLKNTGVNYDMALSGDGFFAVTDTDSGGTTSVYYTRAGNFRMGDNGALQNANGFDVQGWAMSVPPTVVSSNPNTNIFTNEYTKLLSTKIISYSTSIETITSKATDYTSTPTADSKDIFSGAGLKEKSTKISDVEALIKAYTMKMQLLKEDPNGASASASPQYSHIDLPDEGAVGAVEQDGDEVYVYINGVKISQSYIVGATKKEGYIKTMKAFSDKISRTPGIKAYTAIETTYVKSTKDTDIEKGVIRIESLIPGQIFTISSTSMVHGGTDKPGAFAIDVAADPGRGVGALNSVSNALNKAITGKQTDVYTPEDLGNLAAGDKFTYRITVYDKDLSRNVIIPAAAALVIDERNVDDIVAKINADAELLLYIKAENINGNLIIRTLESNFDVEYSGDLIKTDSTDTPAKTGAIKKNDEYSNREGAGAEYMEITTRVDQTATRGSLQLRLDTLEISDSVFGKFNVDQTGLVTIGQDGALYAVGQISIAKFISNRGLEPIGDNLLARTLASGDPVYNLNNNKTAEIVANTLELSKADLSESLVNLMVFQRAFEANAKSITTADTILNTLIQLKR
jgi:flagellar hook protein FlgE